MSGKRVDEHIRGGGRVWYYTPALQRSFPIPDDGERGWEFPDERLNERERQLRAIHMRVIGPLERRGERLFLQVFAEGYQMHYRLMLYRPRR